MCFGSPWKLIIKFKSFNNFAPQKLKKKEKKKEEGIFIFANLVDKIENYILN